MISSVFRRAAPLIARTAVRTYTPAVVRSQIACKLPMQRMQIVRTFAAGGDFFLNPDDVAERVITVVKNFDKVDEAKVSSTSKFADDLGLDSLDAVEVVMAIEDEFAIEIPDAEADKILSVEDAVKYIAAHPQAK
ncbi:hypothetical protein TrLO_g5445 [Triparma laevis f. longispina]|uniref:Acyl carrier protein n=2 Tax=Triparma laevis TaxID=1534972 RepID=A0A9W6ZKJ3_9STRA|nr:hypothetical protein TrLO_g5445 [Triparma laevis f. longispina]